MCDTSHLLQQLACYFVILLLSNLFFDMLIIKRQNKTLSAVEVNVSSLYNKWILQQSLPGTSENCSENFSHSNVADHSEVTYV